MARPDPQPRDRDADMTWAEWAAVALGTVILVPIVLLSRLGEAVSLAARIARLEHQVRALQRDSHPPQEIDPRVEAALNRRLGRREAGDTDTVRDLVHAGRHDEAALLHMSGGEA